MCPLTVSKKQMKNYEIVSQFKVKIEKTDFFLIAWSLFLFFCFFFCSLNSNQCKQDFNLTAHANGIVLDGAFLPRGRHLRLTVALLVVETWSREIIKFVGEQQHQTNCIRGCSGCGQSHTATALFGVMQCCGWPHPVEFVCK
jgi:hypothetical protein